ncbi:hypothetical protein [Enterococcus faecalis]|uniref:hypothetical protein n=1 Tax=Enterococcus faecalis TaxID=1351 RepID=UPI003CC69BFF
MAIYFQDMSAQEMAMMAEELMYSGEVVDLSRITKPKIDRYSTGGVGDKTSIVLSCLAAATGVVVPSMNGGDEDFLINNLDKLGSIPGFTANLTKDQFSKQLYSTGLAFAKQIKEIAPVDEIIYKMRQEIATIQSARVPLGFHVDRLDHPVCADVAEVVRRQVAALDRAVVAVAERNLGVLREPGVVVRLRVPEMMMGVDDRPVVQLSHALPRSCPGKSAGCRR